MRRIARGKIHDSFGPYFLVFFVPPGGTAAAAPGLLRLGFIIEGQLFASEQDIRRKLIFSANPLVLARVDLTARVALRSSWSLIAVFFLSMLLAVFLLISSVIRSP